MISRIRIFDRFTQSDSPDVHYVEGAGLGLSIAKAIVEKHNGHLSFDTTLGAGTSFYVDIPEWRKTDPATSRITGPDRRCYRILIA